MVCLLFKPKCERREEPDLTKPWCSSVLVSPLVDVHPGSPRSPLTIQKKQEKAGRCRFNYDLPSSSEPGDPITRPRKETAGQDLLHAGLDFSEDLNDRVDRRWMQLDRDKNLIRKEDPVIPPD